MNNKNNINIGNLFDSLVEEYRNRDAIHFKEKKISYDELQQNVNIIANALINLGIRPGDNVCIWMPNCPEWIYIDYAVSKVGGVLIPMNLRYKQPEIEYILQFGDVTALFIMDELYDFNYLKIINGLCPELKHTKVGRLNLKKFPRLKNIICLSDKEYPGIMPYKEIIRMGRDTKDKEVLAERQNSIHYDDNVKMFFTSGTTAFPKGSILTHRLQVNIENISNAINIVPEDKMVVPTYLFYILGNLQQVLCPLMKGACIVLLDRFEVEEVLGTIENESCTILDGVPTVYSAYLSSPALKSFNLSSLRTGRIGGAPTSIQLIRNVIEKLHVPELHTMYGMTECTCVTTLTAKGDPPEVLSQTVGKPLPGVEVRVINPETGETLRKGQEGELLVRGHLVLKEYYNRKEETAKAIDKEGWFHTGDLLRERDDGYFEFVGRIKDMIKRGGENVSVAEVENCICSNPNVLQCEVVGVPDPKYDEVGMAFIILKEGRKCTADEMVEYCKKRLASFKIPKYIEFVNEYPVTATGKVQKFKLRELATQLIDKQDLGN